MSKLAEFFNGLMALVVTCVVVGLVIAVIAFGGVFLTAAGIITGAGILILLIGAGIYEWLSKPDGS